MARYVYHCPLRWSDMDAFQHVNNARFLTLYEEARVALMFNGAKKFGLTSFAEGVVVARHEIDYLRPVDYGIGSGDGDSSPEVRIELWASEIRNAAFVVDYELFDDQKSAGKVASRARSVLVPFDLVAGRPRRISEAEREFLEAWRG
ncbi:acyl-CoA thioesterase [Phytomonospora endophytica]|uniref:Acyl-CoA thioester hydrolase n=1 Tax=Phytomonospora endophytica TaxID=714109 RepID=A0A841FAF2_9ACTN|nr:thioesterase family protein [Phytomonospora endophytica]MBB6032265.1 acyl-CoA thioester hydrolase [Phytomonospora endophytica]GIG68615.1 thioesterase [Phytomonospora endophytica]